ncbi:unnamed protein product [Chondrus crispus]|uniref:Uncharacterized protein n=1 Tax=Chondrus crispus TaxID=2769 RepID=R7QER1_CHOCR|nr:unnamed protein product [Chondrus crispus]CDF36278.1 unnamed protein product [Chondrus crispus]|eukprot:XP_005716097.1 unnamed protein product [Chondrus crispus]
MLKSASPTDLPKHDPEGQAVLKRISSALTKNSVSMLWVPFSFILVEKVEFHLNSSISVTLTIVLT